MRKKWYEKGIQFECQGSGKCCLSRGEHGFVYVNLEDRQRFAKHLGIKTQEFTRDYCTKADGFYHLNESADSDECLFLKDNKCDAYEARPTQCRTWPFWPENMSPRAWKKDVVDFCPGANKGRIYSAPEIEKILEIQKKSEKSSN